MNGNGAGTRTDKPIGPANRNGSTRKKRGGKDPWKIGFIVLAVIVVIGAVGSLNSGRKASEHDNNLAAPSRTERQDVSDITAGGQETPSLADRQDNADVSAGDQTVQDEPTAPAVPGVGDLGDYHVEVKGAVLAEDYKGNPAVVITYNWTNNSDKDMSAMSALDGDAFQDGIGLETAIIMDSDMHDGNAYMTKIRPGSSLDVTLAYVLKNTTSVIEFELSELISFSDDVVAIAFDPASAH